MVIQTFFPEERELLKEESAIEPLLAKEFKKEAVALHKLGIDDYEIKYILSIRSRKKARLKQVQAEN